MGYTLNLTDDQAITLRDDLITCYPMDGSGPEAPPAEPAPDGYYYDKVGNLLRDPTSGMWNADLWDSQLMDSITTIDLSQFKLVTLDLKSGVNNNDNYGDDSYTLFKYQGGIEYFSMYCRKQGQQVLRELDKYGNVLNTAFGTNALTVKGNPSKPAYALVCSNNPYTGLIVSTP